MNQFSLRRYLCFFLLPSLLLLPVNGLGFQSYSDQFSPPPFQGPASLQQAEQNCQNQDCDLVLQIREMADRLYAHLEDPDPQVGVLADGLVVCTFVDNNKLSRTSSFGRYLAGQLMSEFQQRSFTVHDIQKSLSIQVQQKRGEYGLSRNPDEIAGDITTGAMLTGTYLNGKDHIIVNARILDNRTSSLLSSATVLFPKNQLTRQLLADSASARTQPQEFMYLKKLEL